MAFPYQTLDDSQQKLQGTVVQTKEGPYFLAQIHGLSRDQRTLCYPLPVPDQAKFIEKPLTDDFFLFKKTIQLGYVNILPEALFISRKPVRKVRQGLDKINVHIPAFQVFDPANPRIYWDGLIKNKALADSFNGKFPSLPEAVKENKRRITAFNRRFAVGMDDELDQRILFYKGTKSGLVTDDNEVMLVKRCHFLKEVVEDLGVKVKLKGV